MRFFRETLTNMAAMTSRASPPIRHLVPMEVSIKIYKSYILPHLEYCCPVFLGIGKCSSKKLKNANHYALKTLLNMGNISSYEMVFSIASLRSLEQRRYEKLLIIVLK